MNDDERLAKEFEDYLEREELIWEIWLRCLMIEVMPNRQMYQDWLHVRRNRGPEEKYGRSE